MRRVFSYHWLIGAFIAMFFAMQSYSLSHATAFEDDHHHHHDDVACDITAVAPEEDVILPADSINTITETYSFPNYYNDFIGRPFETFLSRGPPPRAPPTLF